MTGRNNSQRRRLDRPAELVDIDRTNDKPWWRRWFRGGHHFELVQDGKKIAAVSTLLRQSGSLTVTCGTYSPVPQVPDKRNKYSVSATERPGSRVIVSWRLSVEVPRWGKDSPTLPVPLQT